MYFTRLDKVMQNLPKQLPLKRPDGLPMDERDVVNPFIDQAVRIQANVQHDVDVVDILTSINKMELIA